MYKDICGQTFSHRHGQPNWQIEFLQLFVEFFVVLCVPCAHSVPEQHWCILSNVKKTLVVMRGPTVTLG